MNDFNLTLDDRPIVRIGWNNPLEWIAAGPGGTVDKIDVAEHHCGDYVVFWIQTWRGGKVCARYNARNVDTIIYEEINEYYGGQPKEPDIIYPEGS